MAGRVEAAFSSFLVSLAFALLLVSLWSRCSGGLVRLAQAQEQVNFRLITATVCYRMHYLGIAAAASVRLQKTWCVAKPSSDKATLIANLNYACSQVDCSVLQRRGACFDPDTLISHASIAMNLYYQAMGRNRWNCYFDDSALVVATDPS
ncbi:unnamed protein product, partial [Musa textilis]